MSADPSIPPPPPAPPAGQSSLPRNFYRAILRRRTRPLLVALLVSFWSFMILEGYRTPDPEPDEETIELTLHVLNRELRLADALDESPDIYRWLLLADPRREVLKESLKSLEQLHQFTPLEGDALRAKLVLRRELGKPANLTELAPDEFAALLGRRTHGNATWWDDREVRQLAARQSPETPQKIVTRGDPINQRLLTRAMSGALLSWVVLLVGLCYLPATWRGLRGGLRAAPQAARRSYGWRWPLGLIITLFIVTDVVAGFGIDYLALLVPDHGSFGFDVALDFIWRITAPVLLLVIFFRKPAHAIRSLGLDQKPKWKVILGAFAILYLFDLGLYLLMEPWIESDPAGNLDPMEAGWRGLAYGLLSACIAAPVAEEITYRGFLLRGLSTNGRFWLAAILSSLAFTVVHYYDVYGTISVGVFGLATAVVYRATGCLTNAILLHVLYNLLITVSSWLIYHSPL